MNSPKRKIFEFGKLSATGVVDLQVNGYLGMSYSDPELTEASFLDASEKLLKRGVDLFLPTVITSPDEHYQRNLPRLSEWIEHPRLGGRLPGLHLEGPFLSPSPGAIGAHRADWAQPPSPAALDKLQKWARGTIRLLTVAADSPGVTELIRHATEMGIVVSVGHHLADERQLNAAAEAGARLLTHLGNGVPNQVSRHENPIWAGLACDALTAMVIPDGHHLPASLLKIFLRVKGADRILATSDQSSVAGMPPGRYSALGNDAILEPNGKLHNPSLQCLVGSAMTLPECVERWPAGFDVDPGTLRKMTRTNALRILGMEDSAP
ncbi:MAG: N-acetylglucosamine-6-phosphate deacetylase [Kiritimatiellia bacterium]|nr:N-acetylglucosamine-6-phosphate deacetylase [Kiritimatiellia bacterium]